MTTDADFFPLLVLDAVLTGAKGMNLWSSFRVPPPQRSARLYRALVERGLASGVYGALVPTEDPFLYTVSATATTARRSPTSRPRMLAELDGVVRDGITAAELTRAKAQLHARLVFESDSVTNIAHQLGYFETIGSLDAYTRGAAADRRRHARWGGRGRPARARRVQPHGRLFRPDSDRLMPSRSRPHRRCPTARRSSPGARRRRRRYRSTWRCAPGRRAIPPAGREPPGCCRASSTAARRRVRRRTSPKSSTAAASR